MKNLFFYTIFFLLSISCMRVLAGYDTSYNLSLTRLLAMLSNLDVDFEHTLESITNLRNTLIMPNLPNISSFVDIFGWLSGFVRYIFAISVGVVGSLVSLVQDILLFLYSIIVFFKELVFPTVVV